jgi:predicted metalloprotease with PDZ domain
MPAITVKPTLRLVVHPDSCSRPSLLSSVVFFRTSFVPSSARRKLIIVALITLAASTSIQAQALKLRIAVASTSPARIRINAEFPNPTDVISFPNAYGSVLGLAERIENVEARAAGGQVVAVRKLGPGEFQSSEKFNRTNYEVNLGAPTPPAQGSHVSWLNSEHGLLMLSDLLPRSIKGPGAFSSAQIQLELPAGWSAASNSEKQASLTYFTEESDKTVFLLGPHLQEKSQRIGARDFSVVLSGAWPIAGKDALRITGKIIEEYSKLTGFALKHNAILMLVTFPGNAPPARWTAETRGNAVVLLLGSRGNAKQVKSRLGIVLAHEVFHLWVPNSLNLEGDFDWFFEGFTVYQALRMDLRLHLISFNDYLDTIAHVYDRYLSSPDRDNLSLIQASERRWTTSTSVVYDKAMLVAFLYDLQLRASSVCKSSLADVYLQLFQRVTTGQADANDTIIGVLNAQLGQQSFARQYIEGVEIINLESALSPYGIIVSHPSSGTRLSADHADKAQRKLLNCLAGN